ncbi:oxidoreductase [Rhodococcus ruber]|uniref:PDR/VanB family oxidoreductase n=1 Tax=Rhodococcus TaxID=1827 RepID=UPI00029A092A|nr:MULTISPECIES: PDR/VanB family oxidoreductase [Rhodococcus]ATQ30217.1 oxidoreductase [Rhodococcus ruber]
MNTIDTPLTLNVARRQEATSDVVILELATPDGTELPKWSAGAHIDLHLKDGLTRQYSLCGDPDDRSRWRIAVLREPNSRGGSEYVHTSVLEQTDLTVSHPRNHFELLPAARYIFIAGGIGITPILAMLQSDTARNAEWELHYGGRSRESMAFTDELATTYADRVQLHPQDEVGLLDLDTILGEPRADTLIYCCGPGPLLDAVEERCKTWPEGALRLERFAPKESANLTQDGSFEVELRSSGVSVQVHAGQSILDAVRGVGASVAFSCEEGTCGTCEVSVLEGEVDHRDSILSPEEQADNDTMFICVSRAACPRLVLDL